ncbi:MAG TPA: 2-oxo acid dehydrogenase subunit E2 [Pirellulales bacterium]|jgi:pyruvate dehydrogenase E2 component (dihydrolipoamide acetyltransferase)
MPEFKLPELGENIESADVVSVLVNEGDIIKPQQDVVEIETDKAVLAVPSDVGGKVTKIHVARGQTVKPGQAILSVDAAAAGAASTAKAAAPGGAKAAPAKPSAPAKSVAPAKSTAPTAKSATASHAASEKPAAKPAATTAAPSKPTSAPSSRGGSQENGHAPTKAEPRREVPAAVEVEDESPETEAADDHGDGTASAPAGPAVRRLARELGVDLARIRGTGPNRRITREDVVLAVRQANVVAASAGGGTERSSDERDGYGAVRREAMSKIRKTIAINMVRSVSTIPHLTNFDDADISELEHLRKESAGAYNQSGIKLTSLAFVLKAVALALKQQPTLNASVDMEAGEIIYKQYVNLGVAVDTDRGLIVPVLRGVDGMSIPQIAQGIQALADKVRHGKQTLDDLRGGTFTISNLGAVGGQYSTPIINHPEVAILLLGRSRKLPVVTADDKIEPRLTMPLSLSYDHRVVDGATASRFLNEVIGYLESPGRLLLAP